MAITTLNLRGLNRSDTASSGQVVTATSAVAMDFQAAGGKVKQIIRKDATGATADSTNFSGSNGGTIGNIGTAHISQAITPTDAASIIVVTASSAAGITSNANAGAAIFAGSTCKSWMNANGQSTDADGFAIHAAWVAGSTSAVTVEFRTIGSFVGSAVKLGAMSAGDGAATNPLGSMTIMEILN